MKKVLLALIFILASNYFYGAEKVQLKDMIITNHDVRIVNFPTAYTLPRGSYVLNMRLYSDGGLYTTSYFSFSENLIMGIFLNATNVVGDKKIVASAPNISAKLKIFNQKNSLPAVALGYNSIVVTQAVKKYHEFYAVASRKMSILQGILVHFGVYTTTINNIKKKDLHYYAGFTKNFENGFGIYSEVLDPLNLNDYQINLGLKYNFSPALELELILRNVNADQSINREIGVSYSNYF